MLKDTYVLSWNRDDFRSKLRLFLLARREAGQKAKAKNYRTKADGYSALSSTYYSIVGTAYAQLREVLQHKWSTVVLLPLWCLTWLPLAAWCWWRMLPLSDKVVSLVGYGEITADQADIRQSILRKRRKYKDALFWAEFGLKESPKRAHTRGLLHIGASDSWKRLGNNAEADRHLHLAIEEARLAEDEDCLQAIRIYRQAAAVTDDYVETENWLYRARLLAKETGAKDQLAKIG